MQKPDKKGNISFLWNDVATMNDDNCSFIICKSMVKLSRELPEILNLEKVAVSNITKAMTRSGDEQEISGDVQLAIEYETTDNNLAELSFAVPFSGDYWGTAEIANKPQAVYVDAQTVGFNNLLLETVLSVPNRSRLTRGNDVVIGDFQLQQKLVLPEQWPPLAQIIASQVGYHLDDCQKDGDLLKLRGQQDIGVLYVANQSFGEKVMLYQTTEDFAVDLRTDAQVNADTDLNIGYYSLTAQNINEQEILINSNCNVRAPYDSVAADKERQASPAMLEEALADSQSVEAPQVEEQRQDTAEPLPVVEQPVELAQEQNQNQQEMTSEAKPAAKPSSRPQAKGRPSRRDNLLKYMRNLDCGVRTPKCSRNITMTTEETPSLPPTIEEENEV